MKTELEIKNLKKDLEFKLNSLLDYNLRQIYISAINTLNWISNEKYKNFNVSKYSESLTDQRYKDLFFINKNCNSDLEILEKKILEKEYKENEILKLTNSINDILSDSCLYIRKDIIINLIISIQRLIKDGD